ncbi:MAG: sporulation integral membrane protein YtvI [Oscillospiraceae bacterium]|nr:sporulation integral membrane protein YtvI [Oscillospiraceae bacterium]
MSRPAAKQLAALVGVFLLVWLGLRFLLPLVLPFLLGIGIALAAEPMVRLLHRRVHLPRGLAAGVGVTATLLLLTCVLTLLAALLVRELGQLVSALPDLGNTAMDGISTLEIYLTDLANQTPEGIRPVVTKTVTGMFSSSSAIVDEVMRKIPGIATAILGQIPNSFLTIGTTVLSGFMVSARLPKLRQWLSSLPAAQQLKAWLPALGKVRSALGGWLKAQLKLSGICFLILLAGLLLLKIPYAPIWAFLIALVDAIPILGTGTVLLPWSLVCLVQQESFRALGLLSIYVATFLSRSVFEPRLVGKHLGLDPLLTLLCLYIGYRLWGIGGMILAPMLCVAAVELAKARPS